MKVFDFNIHLALPEDDSTSVASKDETKMGPSEIALSLDHSKNTFQKNVNGTNFMLLNQDLFFNNGNISDFSQKAHPLFEQTYFTAVINFRDGLFRDAIDNAIDQGITGIKFHSYIQSIADEDFEDVLQVAQYAQDKGLYICIDTSFGTSKMYVHDNLKLAAYLSDHIIRIPIILLHSAGARIFEAMLLAEDKHNIILETSFSLPYYAGSSLEADFAFAYRKIGTDRILYGSDFPYVSLEESIEFVTGFLEKYSFTLRETEDIMYNNAIAIHRV